MDWNVRNAEAHDGMRLHALDGLPGEPDVAAVRNVAARDQVEHRGLARTVGADEPHDAACSTSKDTLRSRRSGRRNLGHGLQREKAHAAPLLPSRPGATGELKSRVRRNNRRTSYRRGEGGRKFCGRTTIMIIAQKAEDQHTGAGEVAEHFRQGHDEERAEQDADSTLPERMTTAKTTTDSKR